ncbi:hypothetical protein ZWY2020_038937 [Hordeum vulgare]|nr:hypothetical protein ZWY2020_038937 [Hordeum vulgare]
MLVKFRVEDMRDVPINLVVGELDEPNSESWTVPIVIVQQELLLAHPPEEDPVAPEGNPHPPPNNPFFHPNQLNHFVGPLQQDQAHDDIGNGFANNQVLQNNHEEEDEPDEDLRGLSHRAMRANEDDLNDQEIE